MTEKMAKEEKKLDNKDKKGYKSYCFGEIAICEEYLNGKKTGEGKIYYVGDEGFIMGIDGIEGGKLIYEGGILNSKKNGKGKEYNEINEKLIYEGEFLDDKKMEKEKNMEKQFLKENI